MGFASPHFAWSFMSRPENMGGHSSVPTFKILKVSSCHRAGLRRLSEALHGPPTVLRWPFEKDGGPPQPVEATGRRWLLPELHRRSVEPASHPMSVRVGLIRCWLVLCRECDAQSFAVIDRSPDTRVESGDWEKCHVSRHNTDPHDTESNSDPYISAQSAYFACETIKVYLP